MSSFSEAVKVVNRMVAVDIVVNGLERQRIANQIYPFSEGAEEVRRFF